MSPADRLPKYVDKFCARGRVYFYFRRGRIRHRLPGTPADAAFWTEYAARLAQSDKAPSPRAPEPGSVAALVADYKSSDEYLRLAPSTKLYYPRMLDRLAPIGAVPVDQVRRAHVRELAKPLRATPGEHRRFTAVTSRLFSFAIDNDYELVGNPAARMKRIGKSTSWKAWTDEQLAAFEASDPPRWMRTAYMLARYAGQREGDIVRLPRSAYDGASLTLTQRKTGEALTIRVHQRLKTYLDALPRDSLLFVTRPDGKAWRAATFSNSFGEWLRSHGLHGLQFHGLRHTAGKALAEAGCTAHQIAAVLGHRSLTMVLLYTRAAEQKRLATEAIGMLERRRAKDE